ncbi:MAG: hypothetical protein Q7S57_00500 [bacterium]|nr:hypothetical protein [bacterium]
MFKKSIIIFGFALLFNWFWEIAHSVLYVNYQGGAITSFVLFRAALVDAVIILFLIFIAEIFKLNKTLFIVGGGLLVAIVIEIWAMHIHQRTYNALMPIIPIIKTGLTPTIQLAVTGLITLKLAVKNHI